MVDGYGVEAAKKWLRLPGGKALRCMSNSLLGQGARPLMDLPGGSRREVFVGEYVASTKQLLVWQGMVAWTYSWQACPHRVHPLAPLRYQPCIVEGHDA